MEIIVKVGNEQQKKLIRDELTFIAELNTSLSLESQITKLIVPDDFDSEVNDLQKTSCYKSNRAGNLAMAKNVSLEDGVALVLSPMLYTDNHDSHTRFLIYTHEFFHVVTKSLFSEIPNNSRSNLTS